MSKGKFAIGAIFGAVTGFVTGVLLAPKSGKDTLNDLRSATLETKDTVLQNAEKVKDVAEQKAKEAKDVAEQKAKEAKTWSEDVIEEVSGKVNELKGRAEKAIEGAKDGFKTSPEADTKADSKTKK
jgi:gas vesicle protein